MNWFGFDYCMFFRVLIVCRLVVWHFGLFPVGTVSCLWVGCLGCVVCIPIMVLVFDFGSFDFGVTCLRFGVFGVV